MRDALERLFHVERGRQKRGACTGEEFRAAMLGIATPSIHIGLRVAVRRL